MSTEKNLRKPMLSRREALWQLGGGLGGIALAAMLQADGLASDTGNLAAASQKNASPLARVRPTLLPRRST